ncbi:MAG: WecB/TagA/CpsF family glycosyltransferase, partial [Lentisphaeraceae bacterium]|nr:WecB/TagA/CpsF family glycosyltransferase [Lentisphaeraceae bacterium]
ESLLASDAFFPFSDNIDIANEYGIKKIIQPGGSKKDQEVIEQINKSGAQLHIVAMGSPKQEEWILKYRNQLNPVFCQGVGGTFDVASGRVKWAPVFFRKTGTEWLFRLISEPKRLKRQLVLPKFLFCVLHEKFTASKKAQA